MNTHLKYLLPITVLLAAGCRTETTTTVTPTSGESPGTSTTVTTTTPAVPTGPAPGAPAGQSPGTSPATLVSPFAGRWSGKSDMKDKGIDTFVNSIKGGPLTGASYLTLNADGSGFLQVGDKRDRPILWKPKDGNIVIQRNPNDTGGKDSGLGGGPWVASVSEDGKTMHVDMSQVRLTLHKE